MIHLLAPGALGDVSARPRAGVEPANRAGALGLYSRNNGRAFVRARMETNERKNRRHVLPYLGRGGAWDFDFTRAGPALGVGKNGSTYTCIGLY